MSPFFLFLLFSSALASRVPSLNFDRSINNFTTEAGRIAAATEEDIRQLKAAAKKFNGWSQRLVERTAMKLADELLKNFPASSECPPPWTKAFGTSCLLFSNYTIGTWTGARAFCQHHGGDLVMMRSHEEAVQISNFLKAKTTVPKIWHQTQNGHHWCNAFSVSAPFAGLEVKECDFILPFVCQKVVLTAKEALVSALRSTTSMFREKERTFVKTQSPVWISVSPGLTLFLPKIIGKWRDPRAFCKRYGGDLATIRSPEEGALIFNFTRTFVHDIFKKKKLNFKEIMIEKESEPEPDEEKKENEGFFAAFLSFFGSIAEVLGKIVVALAPLSFVQVGYFRQPGQTQFYDLRGNPTTLNFTSGANISITKTACSVYSLFSEKFVLMPFDCDQQRAILCRLQK